MGAPARPEGLLRHGQVAGRVSRVHQTFNLVPSLITQLQDYVAGTAQDPFLQVASRPARDLSLEERCFALQYLFQANAVNLIGRYPRYRELWERFRSAGDSPERAERLFQPQDFTDLQVLSQIAWFDEFFLEDRDVRDLIRKERSYTLEDQRFVIKREREVLAQVLPAHAAAAQKGLIELSTSPFYHPILPLLCDTNAGAISTPGLPLPQNRFRRPEDARDQILRGLDLHEKIFGVRPKGIWPSEGSVSEEAIAIAHDVGVNWMATDEGVLGRSTGLFFWRDGEGRLPAHLAEKLYNIHRYENGSTAMHLVFRDHTISDLIGFVYSGMPPKEAAQHLIQNLKKAGQPVLDSGKDAVVSIILDGENAWEYYPQSGREFLRRFYEALQNTAGMEAVTISEAIARHRDFNILNSITSRVLDLARTSMSGLAPPKTIAHGTIYSRPALPTIRPRHNAVSPSASLPTKSSSSRKAVIGIGGTAPSIIPQTIATSMSSTASISRTFTTLSD